MAKFNVKKIIEENTVDEVVDYAKVNAAVELQNKNVVAKEIEKELAKVDKEGIIKTFLSENDFGSVDAFNAFKKNGSTADAEAVKRVEKERDDFETKYKELLPLQTENATFKNRAALRGKGTFTQDELEFMEFKINKLDGETFEDKLTAFAEANPDAFTIKPANTISTTGAKVGAVGKDGKFGWEKKLEEKYGELK